MELIAEINFTSTNVGLYGQYGQLRMTNLNLAGYANLFFVCTVQGSTSGGAASVMLNNNAYDYHQLRGETYGSTITYQSAVGQVISFRGATASTYGEGQQNYGWISNPGDSTYKRVTLRTMGWRPQQGYYYDSDWIIGGKTTTTPITSITWLVNEATAGSVKLYGLRK